MTRLRQISSSKARMTRPIRGFGPNEVDLRGIILPARATAITSATVVGCSSTATPPS